jgi:3-isopropylmalate dehydrogenase
MPEQKKIMVLPGDGIGAEVMEQAILLLAAIQDFINLTFDFEEHLIGGAALKAYGIPIQKETLDRCKSADAVLLGAVGDPEFDKNPSHLRPEKALLELRAILGVYCNLRPAKIYNVIVHASSLKPEVIEGIDIMMVRELTGGIYFGKPAERTNKDGIRQAVNTMVYEEEEIFRIARRAFDLAQMRRKKVTSIDKANVLVVSQLWREIVEEVAQDYPEVTLEHMLVDNCAMQLIRQPNQFDVMLTENMFGDIISDEASMLTGSLGMLPSASLGDGTALYEPVHGSAPDIAGLDKANPIAMISSVAMMLNYSFLENKVAQAIENAISSVLTQGYHTPDLQINNGKRVGTKKMGSLIREQVHKNLTE